MAAKEKEEEADDADADAAVVGEANPEEEKEDDDTVVAAKEKEEEAAAAVGEEEEAAAAAAQAAAAVAGEAVGIAARSGFLPPDGDDDTQLPAAAVAAVSREACRAYRRGRTFHVKVTAGTPQHVWSPPSPPPPRVGGRGRAWGAAEASGDGGRTGSATATSNAIAESRVSPLRVSHITWDRNDEDLGDDFALDLPLDLETLTFAFAFNRLPADGVEIDWPPDLKAVHFGMAFNP
ncbi:unnamed protein product, partial [Ectocarpus sp. 8 AP-2014]